MLWLLLIDCYFYFSGTINQSDVLGGIRGTRTLIKIRLHTLGTCSSADQTSLACPARQGINTVAEELEFKTDKANVIHNVETDLIRSHHAS